jgi:hypothetical protein
LLLVAAHHRGFAQVVGVAGRPVEDHVEDHRGDGGEQDAALDQGVDGVGQPHLEVGRDERDHPEADRDRDHEEVVAVGGEVDLRQDADSGRRDHPEHHQPRAA